MNSGSYELVAEFILNEESADFLSRGIAVKCP